jgi:uncharacterized membrane protein YidH (DUF202 family)
METTSRVDRFKAEAADLNLKSGNPGTESKLQALGVVLMVVGILVNVLLYMSSLNIDDQRDIQSNIILGLGMAAMSVVGAALFLRYSLAKFLRFWLLRQLYEGQSHIEEVVDAVNRRA